MSSWGPRELIYERAATSTPLKETTMKPALLTILLALPVLAAAASWGTVASWGT